MGVLQRGSEQPQFESALASQHDALASPHQGVEVPEVMEAETDIVQEYLRLLAQGEPASLEEGLAVWDKLNDLWWAMDDEQHQAVEAALRGAEA